MVDECTMSQAHRSVFLVPVLAPVGPYWSCAVLSQSGKEIERSASRFESREAALFWGRAVWGEEEGRPTVEMSYSEARKTFPYGFCE